MTDTTNDIDALLGYLSICADRYSCHTLPSDVAANYHASLTALVAERDALKQRVAELEAEPSSELSFCERRDRAWAEELRKPAPADRDRELRGRLVCAALTRLCADPRYDFPEEAAIAIADRALAAMRKGEA